MANKILEDNLELNVQFEKRGGIIPVVIQDYLSGEILMVGYANDKALDQTIKTKYATLWSTTNNCIWVKGDTSGDTLRVYDILLDCDQDALVYKVERIGGGVCHTKDKLGKTRKSCFYRKFHNGKLEYI